MDNMVYKEIKAHYRTLAMAAHMIGDACEALSKDFERLELASGQTPSFEPVFMKPSTEHEEFEAIRRNLKAGSELSPEDFMDYYRTFDEKSFDWSNYEDLLLKNPSKEPIAYAKIDIGKDGIEFKEGH